MIIIIVIKVLAFIILLIAIFCWKEKLKVIQVLYIVDVFMAVAAIIGGIVCLAVTVTEMTSCEGPICNTNIGLSITCLFIGLLNTVFIIFFLGSLMDMAGVNNKPLADHFCAFPRKKDDKPTNGQNSPTGARVVDIGVANSENSRRNGNQGKVPTKSKFTNEIKASTQGNGERKNEDNDTKVANTNMRALILQPFPSSEKGEEHDVQTNSTNSKLETDNGKKKKRSKKNKKTKKKPSDENGGGSSSPPAVSVSGVDVDDQKTAGKPEEQLGSLSKLTGVESPE